MGTCLAKSNEIDVFYLIRKINHFLVARKNIKRCIISAETGEKQVGNSLCNGIKYLLRALEVTMLAAEFKCFGLLYQL